MSTINGYELLTQTVNADGVSRSERRVRNYFTALKDEEIKALCARFGLEREAVRKKHERAKELQVTTAQLERIEQSAIKKLRTVEVGE